MEKPPLGFSEILYLKFPVFQYFRHLNCSPFFLSPWDHFIKYTRLHRDRTGTWKGGTIQIRFSTCLEKYNTFDQFKTSLWFSLFFNIPFSLHVIYGLLSCALEEGTVKEMTTQWTIMQFQSTTLWYILSILNLISNLKDQIVYYSNYAKLYWK